MTRRRSFDSWTSAARLPPRARCLSLSRARARLALDAQLQGCVRVLTSRGVRFLQAGAAEALRSMVEGRALGYTQVPLTAAAEGAGAGPRSPSRRVPCFQSWSRAADPNGSFSLCHVLSVGVHVLSCASILDLEAQLKERMGATRFHLVVGAAAEVCLRVRVPAGSTPARRVPACLVVVGVCARAPPLPAPVPPHRQTVDCAPFPACAAAAPALQTWDETSRLLPVLEDVRCALSWLRSGGSLVWALGPCLMRPRVGLLYLLHRHFKDVCVVKTPACAAGLPERCEISSPSVRMPPRHG